MTDDYDDMKQRWHGVPPEEPEIRPEDSYGERRMKIITEVTSRIVWSTPPQSTAEAAMRDQANKTVKAAAERCQPAVQLIVLEMINVITGGSP